MIDFTYKILWRKIPELCMIINGVEFASMFGLDSAKVPAWVLLYSISGLKHLPEERITYMTKDLEDIAKDYSVTPLNNLSGVSGDKMLEVTSGPSDGPLWKEGKKGGCQDVFFLTTMDKAQGYISAVEELCKEHKFPKEDLGIYIQPIRHGTGCHLEFSFMYNPQDKDESKKVKKLWNAVSKKCLDTGGFFSRPYGSWADMAYEKCPDTASALNKMKNIFDPKNVMNPENLCFKKEA